MAGKRKKSLFSVAFFFSFNLVVALNLWELGIVDLGCLRLLCLSSCNPHDTEIEVVWDHDHLLQDSWFTPVICLAPLSHCRINLGQIWPLMVPWWNLIVWKTVYSGKFILTLCSFVSCSRLFLWEHWQVHLCSVYCPEKIPIRPFSPLFLFVPVALFNASSLHINHQVCVHNIISQWRQCRQGHRPFKCDSDWEIHMADNAEQNIPFFCFFIWFHVCVVKDRMVYLLLQLSKIY